MSVTEYTALKDWTVVNNLLKGMWKESVLILRDYPTAKIRTESLKNTSDKRCHFSKLA
jgi:hypothetical protein